MYQPEVSEWRELDLYLRSDKEFEQILTIRQADDLHFSIFIISSPVSKSDFLFFFFIYLHEKTNERKPSLSLKKNGWSENTIKIIPIWIEKISLKYMVEFMVDFLF